MIEPYPAVTTWETHKQNNNDINLFVCLSGTTTHTCTHAAYAYRDINAETHKHIKRFNGE